MPEVKDLKITEIAKIPMFPPTPTKIEVADKLGEINKILLQLCDRINTLIEELTYE